MRKPSLLIASLVVLLSCDQTTAKKDFAVANNTPNEQQTAVHTAKTVGLIVEPATLKLSALPENIKATMINNTTDTIMTGLHYSIEKSEDGQWNEVSPDGIVFHDLGWRLKPSHRKSFEKNLYKDQVKFTVGAYRIVKYYLKSDYSDTKKTLHVYAEFNITE